MKFITLFNETYLTRGLALYESLRLHCGTDFELAVLAMSPLALGALRDLSLPNLVPIALEDFETQELLSVKSTRTLTEYCWTCTPYLLLHAIHNLGWNEVFYLDADLYFYHNPKPVIDEWLYSESSIFLTDHWYTPRYDQTQESGRFCVQFLGFKRREEGLSALKWWAGKCLNWCYARHEHGLFGDQKYLDDWPQRFSGVWVNQNRGVGVAPWNIQQYELIDKDLVRHRQSGQVQPLYFYHFHGLAWTPEGAVFGGYYQLGPHVRTTIYRPYLKKLLEWEQKLLPMGLGRLRNVLPKKPLWRRGLSLLWHRMQGTWNVLKEEL